MRLRSLALVAIPLLLAACGTTDGTATDPCLLDTGEADTLSLDNPDAPDTGVEDTEGADTNVDDTGLDTGEPDTATGTDTSEDPAVDTQPDTAMDTSLDTGEDVGDPDVEYIPDPAIPSVCDELCDDLGRACGIAEIQGADCADYCVEVMREDQRHLAAFVCAQESCDPGCFDHAPEVSGACTDYCDAGAACDLLDDLDMPEDPAICAVACAGYERTTDEFVPETIACMANELEATCDQDAAERCFYVHPYGLCDDICEELDDTCGGDTAFGATGYDGCMESCLLRDTPESVWAWGLCTQTTTCDGYAVCDAVPVVEPQRCIGACDVAIDQCPAPARDGLTPEEQCGAACMALDSFPDNSAEDAAECVADIDGCVDNPRNDSPAFIEMMVSCVIDPADVCFEACGSLATCDPGSEFLDDCLFLCSTTVATDPAMATSFEACVDDASTPCDKAGCLASLEP